jgi:hypothetical protein
MSLSPTALILTDSAMTCQRSNDLPEVGIKGAAMRRKYISLLLMAKGHSRESLGTDKRSVDTRLLNARSTTGICMVAAQTQTIVKGAMLEMAAQTRHAISVE